MENCINLVIFPQWLYHIDPLTSLSATSFTPSGTPDPDFHPLGPTRNALVHEIRIQPLVISAGTRFLPCFSDWDSLDVL